MPGELSSYRRRENIGSLLLAGVTTKVLFGDPSMAGLYTVVLSVPANTKIAAHAHTYDRMATVVWGTWRFGYGDRFEEQGLKLLPGERLFRTRWSEPLCANGSRTGVLVEISGFDPTNTHYVDPKDEPAQSKR